MHVNNSARTLLFVDGPNIDATLGNGVLERKPTPQERARWDRVKQFAQNKLGVDKPSFVLNGDRFGLETTAFYRCLKHIGYNVATPKHSERCKQPTDDPVDEWIKNQLGHAAATVGNGEISGVVLLTHDGGFAPALKEILEAGGSVTIVGFLEWIGTELVALRSEGAILLDLERDAGAFDVRLDRPDITTE